MNIDLILSVLTIAMVAIMAISLSAFFIAYKRTGNAFYLMALFSAHPRIMFFNRNLNIINLLGSVFYVAILMYFNLDMALIAWFISLLAMPIMFAFGIWSHREANRIRNQDSSARHMSEAMTAFIK